MKTGWALGGDRQVSRVGYGAMKLTGWPRGDRPDRDTGLAVLRRAVEFGVNHIDTSNYYARDGVAANELIRTALYRTGRETPGNVWDSEYGLFCVSWSPARAVCGQ